MMALRRVFCKVYLRIPWRSNSPVIVSYFAGQFVRAANAFASQPMLVSCFRCGREEELASLSTPAKVVKVCSASSVKGQGQSWISDRVHCLLHGTSYNSVWKFDFPRQPVVQGSLAPYAFQRWESQFILSHQGRQDSIFGQADTISPHFTINFRVDLYRSAVDASACAFATSAAQQRGMRGIMLAVTSCREGTAPHQSRRKHSLA